MKRVVDVRQTFTPDFKRQTIEIEGVELGDVKGKTIQDTPQTPPDRSGQIATIKQEGE